MHPMVAADKQREDQIARLRVVQTIKPRRTTVDEHSLVSVQSLTY